MLMKDQGWFYQWGPLRVLGLISVRVKGMERLIPLVIQKEIVLTIN